MKISVGIDPGLGGYIACLIDDRTPMTWAMPTVKIGKGGKRDYDIPAIKQIIRQLEDSGYDIDIVVVEKQQPMPKQGVTSTFRTGQGYGILQGIFVGSYPCHIVHARSWQAVMHRDIAGDDTKGRSIMKAGQLFPSVDLRKSLHWACKPDHNKADALLLAWYGLHHVLGK